MRRPIMVAENDLPAVPERMLRPKWSLQGWRGSLAYARTTSPLTPLKMWSWWVTY